MFLIPVVLLDFRGRFESLHHYVASVHIKKESSTWIFYGGA